LACHRRALFVRAVKCVYDAKCGTPQEGLILSVVNFHQPKAGLILTVESSLAS